MNRRSVIGISVIPAIVLLQCFSITSLAAEKAIPKGCVKLEDEIKFSGKNVYVSEIGHLTAGKLVINPRTGVDPAAADAIRGDNIPDLKDDDNTLIKGEVALSSTPLPDGPGVTSFDNKDTFDPRTSITLRIQKKDDDGNADISGSIKLTPAAVSLIKANNINFQALDTPISVCGVGMQLKLLNGHKKIKSGTVILYINNGSDKPVALEALFEGRQDKAINHDGFQMAADIAPQDLVGVGQAL